MPHLEEYHNIRPAHSHLPVIVEEFALFVHCPWLLLHEVGYQKEESLEVEIDPQLF
jgi:hypothetical protein